jgi:hypothetical protein
MKFFWNQGWQKLDVLQKPDRQVLQDESTGFPGYTGFCSAVQLYSKSGENESNFS